MMSSASTTVAPTAALYVETAREQMNPMRSSGSLGRSKARRSGLSISKAERLLGPTAAFDSRFALPKRSQSSLSWPLSPSARSTSDESGAECCSVAALRRCNDRLTSPFHIMRKPLCPEKCGLLLGELVMIVLSAFWSSAYLTSTQLWGQIELNGGANAALDSREGIVAAFCVAQIVEVVAAVVTIASIAAFFAGNLDSGVVCVLMRQLNVLTIFGAGAMEVCAHSWRDAVLDLGGGEQSWLTYLHLISRVVSNCVGLLALVSFVLTDAAVQISQCYRVLITLCIVPAKIASYIFSYFDVEVVLLVYSGKALRYGSIVRICESNIILAMVSAVKVILFDRKRLNLAFPSVPMRRPEQRLPLLRDGEEGSSSSSSSDAEGGVGAAAEAAAGGREKRVVVNGTVLGAVEINAHAEAFV